MVQTVLGAIADDFTGATDLGDTLVGNGMPTVQSIGLPSPAVLKAAASAGAMVISLKSRSIPASDAVSQSLNACESLEALGCRQILFKICSTFDSTERGNIGPVADALAHRLNADRVIVAPSFPENKRTVYQGHLFVDDRLLSESGMENHPINPMRDADLRRVMAAQSANPVGHLPWATVRAGADHLRQAIAASDATHLIADAIDDTDLRTLADAIADRRLLVGGSGIARGLPAALGTRLTDGSADRLDLPGGPALILAGSCSTATLAQIDHAAGVLPAVKLTAESIASDAADEVVEKALRQHADGPLVIYASAPADEREAARRRYPDIDFAARIEKLMAAAAKTAAANGIRRFIVAGGETSGAVVQALGVEGLRIGATLAPGVPVTTTIGGGAAKTLVLKSGNFGGPDFFVEALRRTEPGNS